MGGSYRQKSVPLDINTDVFTEYFNIKNWSHWLQLCYFDIYRPLKGLSESTSNPVPSNPNNVTFLFTLIAKLSLLNSFTTSLPLSHFLHIYMTLYMRQPSIRAELLLQNIKDNKQLTAAVDDL